MCSQTTDPADKSDPTGGFRHRLYALRRDKGWSQSELARRVWGTTTDKRGYEVAKNRDRISSYEGGKAVPERANLDALAEALGVGLDQLAPDLVLSSPRTLTTPSAFEMRMVPGDGQMAHVKVDAILPLEVAVKIVNALNEYAMREAQHTKAGGAH